MIVFSAKNTSHIVKKNFYLFSQQVSLRTDQQHPELIGLAQINRLYFQIILGGQQYGCNMCKFASVSEVSLRRHVREVHSADKQVVCQVCGAELKRKESLKKHMMVS